MISMNKWNWNCLNVTFIRNTTSLRIFYTALLFSQSMFPWVSAVNFVLFSSHSLFTFILSRYPISFFSLFQFYKHKKQQPMHKKIINYLCADVVLTSLYSDRRERIRGGTEYMRGGRGRKSIEWLVLLLDVVHPSNATSNPMQCNVMLVM